MEKHEQLFWNKEQQIYGSLLYCPLETPIDLGSDEYWYHHHAKFLRDCFKLFKSRFKTDDKFEQFMIKFMRVEFDMECIDVDVYNDLFEKRDDKIEKIVELVRELRDLD